MDGIVAVEDEDRDVARIVQNQCTHWRRGAEDSATGMSSVDLHGSSID